MTPITFVSEHILMEACPVSTYFQCLPYIKLYINFYGAKKKSLYEIRFYFHTNWLLNYEYIFIYDQRRYQIQKESSEISIKNENICLYYGLLLDVACLNISPSFYFKMIAYSLRCLFAKGLGKVQDCLDSQILPLHARFLDYGGKLDDLDIKSSFLLPGLSIVTVLITSMLIHVSHEQRHILSTPT